MRAKALECEQLAGVARDPAVVHMYTDVARKWRELAAQIDRRNKR
jgi:hypothetical protein